MPLFNSFVNAQGANTVPEITDLAERMLAGDRKALARAITIVENGLDGAETLLRVIYRKTGHAHVVGITGSPGTGKSTLVAGLTMALREKGKTVGILAFDPSSPFTGGAFLGDRVRFHENAADAGVFFRSLGSRGHAGGLSRKAGEVITLMDASGRDFILVETVGAGQSEVDIMRHAHTVVVVLMPGAGDEIQVGKAGILEIGDVYVVNKADREGADRLVAAIELELDLGEGVYDRMLDPTGHHAGLGNPPAQDRQHPAGPERQRWRPPVIKTVARDGLGILEVLEALYRHRQYLESTGAGRRQALHRARELICDAIIEKVLARIFSSPQGVTLFDTLAQAVAERLQDPYSAALQILENRFER